MIPSCRKRPRSAAVPRRRAAAIPARRSLSGSLLRPALIASLALTAVVALLLWHTQEVRLNRVSSLHHDPSPGFGSTVDRAPGKDRAAKHHDDTANTQVVHCNSSNTTATLEPVLSSSSYLSRTSIPPALSSQDAVQHSLRPGLQQQQQQQQRTTGAKLASPETVPVAASTTIATATGDAATATSSPTPRVALLFLVQGNGLLDNEALWSAFLAAADRMTLRAPLPAAAVRSALHVDLEALVGGKLKPPLKPYDEMAYQGYAQQHILPPLGTPSNPSSTSTSTTTTTGTTSGTPDADQLAADAAARRIITELFPTPDCHPPATDSATTASTSTSRPSIPGRQSNRIARGDNCSSIVSQYSSKTRSSDTRCEIPCALAVSSADPRMHLEEPATALGAADSNDMNSSSNTGPENEDFDGTVTRSITATSYAATLARAEADVRQLLHDEMSRIEAEDLCRTSDRVTSSTAHPPTICSWLSWLSFDRPSVASRSATRTSDGEGVGGSEEGGTGATGFRPRDTSGSKLRGRPSSRAMARYRRLGPAGIPGKSGLQGNAQQQPHNTQTTDTGRLDAMMNHFGVAGSGPHPQPSSILARAEEAVRRKLVLPQPAVPAAVFWVRWVRSWGSWWGRSPKMVAGWDARLGAAERERLEGLWKRWSCGVGVLGVREQPLGVGDRTGGMGVPVRGGSGGGEGYAGGDSAAAKEYRDDDGGGCDGSSEDGNSNNSGGSGTGSRDAGSSNNGGGGGGGCGGGDGGWRRFFRLYVHLDDPAVRLQPDSFLGRNAEHVSGRGAGGMVNTTGGYAQHVLMQAELRLLAAALSDPLTARFVLLSETSIPVRPAAHVWTQLMWEQRSRLDACRDVDMDLARWRTGMASTGYLRPEHWRKSSQWFTLTRPHAALAVSDRHVIELFHRHCYTRLKSLPTAAGGPAAAPNSAALSRGSSNDGGGGCGNGADGGGCVEGGGGGSHTAPLGVDGYYGAGAATHLYNDTSSGGDGDGDGVPLVGRRRRRMLGGREALNVTTGGGGRWRSRSVPGALNLVLTSGLTPCVSDEHYLPTLLASYGLDYQTDCLGEVHFADWTAAGGWHPRRMLPRDLMSGWRPDPKPDSAVGGACEGVGASAGGGGADGSVNDPFFDLKHLWGPDKGCWDGEHHSSSSTTTTTMGGGGGGGGSSLKSVSTVFVWPPPPQSPPQSPHHPTGETPPPKPERPPTPFEGPIVPTPDAGATSATWSKALWWRWLPARHRSRQMLQSRQQVGEHGAGSQSDGSVSDLQAFVRVPGAAGTHRPAVQEAGGHVMGEGDEIVGAGGAVGAGKSGGDEAGLQHATEDSALRVVSVAKSSSGMGVVANGGGEEEGGCGGGEGAFDGVAGGRVRGQEDDVSGVRALADRDQVHAGGREKEEMETEGGEEAGWETATPTLRTWLEELGYVPLGYRCHLFARKFPSVTSRATFAAAMACPPTGLGLAPWCHQRTERGC